MLLPPHDMKVGDSFWVDSSSRSPLLSGSIKQQQLLQQTEMSKCRQVFFCSCPAFFLLRPALFYTQAFAHWSCKPVPDPCLDNCPPAAEIQSHDLTLPGISPKMYFTRNVLHQRYRSHRSTLCCSNIAIVTLFNSVAEVCECDTLLCLCIRA